MKRRVVMSRAGGGGEGRGKGQGEGEGEERRSGLPDDLQDGALMDLIRNDPSISEKTKAQYVLNLTTLKRETGNRGICWMLTNPEKTMAAIVARFRRNFLQHQVERHTRTGQRGRQIARGRGRGRHRRSPASTSDENDSSTSSGTFPVVSLPSPQSVLAYCSAITAVIKRLDPDQKERLGGESILRKHWNKCMSDLNTKIRQKYDGWIASDRQRDNFVSWEDLIVKREELAANPETYGSNAHLLLAFLTYMPPMRTSNYGALRLFDSSNNRLPRSSKVKKDIEDQRWNYVQLFKDRGVIVVQDYKTANHYHRLEKQEKLWRMSSGGAIESQPPEGEDAIQTKSSLSSLSPSREESRWRKISSQSLSASNVVEGDANNNLGRRGIVGGGGRGIAGAEEGAGAGAGGGGGRREKTVGTVDVMSLFVPPDRGQTTSSSSFIGQSQTEGNAEKGEFSRRTRVITVDQPFAAGPMVVPAGTYDDRASRRQGEIPPQLFELLLESCHRKPRSWVFVNSKGEPYSSNSFVKHVGVLLSKVFDGKAMSVDLVRHAATNWLDQNYRHNRTVLTYFRYWMMHSKDMQEEYVLVYNMDPNRHGHHHHHPVVPPPVKQ